MKQRKCALYVSYKQKELFSIEEDGTILLKGKKIGKSKITADVILNSVKKYE